jgi:UDP-N-acetylglucosamine 3-dehydrogenase
MTRLRAGLVGLGSMGRNHARLLRELPEVDFVAACDPAGDPEGRAGGVPIVPDVEALLAVGIDLCIVAAPTAAHEEVATTLAAAGVACLIEKPLAGSVAAAQRIAASFASSGVLGAVGHVERYNPALRELRRRLEDGQLGAVHQIATRRQSPFPARIADVGVVLDLASHDLDLTSWVAQQRFQQVAAQTAHLSGREHEDLVAVVGALDGGVVTSHLVNWLTPFKERVTVVTGDQGCFVADTLTADLTFHRNGSIPNEWDAMAVFRGVSEGDAVRYAFAKPEPLRVELQSFIDAVRGEIDADIVTLDDGLHVVTVAEAVLRSAVQGETVRI